MELLIKLNKQQSARLQDALQKQTLDLRHG